VDHLTLAVLDLDVDQVAHMIRVIDIGCRNVIAGTVGPRLPERTRIMMTFRRTARLAGGNLVDVNRMFAVRESLHHHLDGDLLDAFGAGLLHERGRPGNIRIGAALDLRRSFHAVAIGASQSRQADQRGSSHAP
jgi:hypothetical protein